MMSKPLLHIQVSIVAHKYLGGFQMRMDGGHKSDAVFIRQHFVTPPIEKIM